MLSLKGILWAPFTLACLPDTTENSKAVQQQLQCLAVRKHTHGTHYSARKGSCGRPSHWPVCRQAVHVQHTASVLDTEKADVYTQLQCLILRKQTYTLACRKC
jgi:hypothetical protein